MYSDVNYIECVGELMQTGHAAGERNNKGNTKLLEQVGSSTKHFVLSFYDSFHPAVIN